MVNEGLNRGLLDKDGRIELEKLSLFSFIPIYDTFGSDYRVTYDSSKRTVRIEPLEVQMPANSSSQ
jgi:hypothetical protein